MMIDVLLAIPRVPKQIAGVLVATPDGTLTALQIFHGMGEPALFFVSHTRIIT
jgi:hypothetical protein